MIPASVGEHQLLELNFNFPLTIVVKFHSAIAKLSKLMVSIKLFPIQYEQSHVL